MAVNGGPNTAESGVVLSIDGANFKSTNYQENIVTDGLVFYVNSSNPKSNGTLSAKDLVSGNIGTLNGGMTVEGTDWTFDIVGEYMNFGNLPELNWGSGDGTVCAWCKCSSGVGVQVESDTLANDDVWRYIVGVRDGNNLRLYINGVEDPNSPTDITGYGNIDISDPLFIGAGTNGTGGSPGNWLNGSVSSVQIYNRALSPAEVLQNYNAGRLALLTEPINELSYVGNGGTYVNNKNAFRFDGVNDYIDFIDFDYFTGDKTISTWVKLNSIGVAQYIITNFDSLSDGFGVLINTDNTVGITWDNTNNNVRTNSIDALSSGVWYHITCVYNTGGDGEIYINGILKKNGSLRTEVPDTNKIRISGRWVSAGSGTTQELDGQISNLKVYNKALTADEVLQNYNALRQRYVRRDPFVTDGLVFHVDAGDDDSYPGTGTSWYNLEDLSVVGSLVGSPPFNPNDGGLLTFDGTSDYATFGDLSLVNFNNTDAFSVEVWANPDPNDDYGTVVSKMLVSSPFTGWLVDFDTLIDVVRFQFVSNFGTSDYLSLSSPYVFDNTMKHVLVTTDGTGTAAGTKMYINGQQVSINIVLDNLSGNTQNLANFCVGTRNNSTGSTNIFKGNISNVKIYNKALTSQEVLQNYNALKGRYQ
jgi:hypothetical protein